ncbi:MAG: Zn-ribbon domain-containing OB-fold protein [Candidatus Micrarchaeia archaeon]
MKRKVPIIDELFEWPSDNPRLIGTKCPLCGSIQFPKSSTCNNPECNHSIPPEKYFLSTEGTLYTYTVHAYGLGEPFQYHKAPYIVGAVELPDGIIVLGRIKVFDEKSLKIGMKMKLEIDKLYEDEENEYLTYFFVPVVNK